MHTFLINTVEWIAQTYVSSWLPSITKVHQIHLPWTQKWIAGADVQVAPQETEIPAYVVGGTKQDVDQYSFKGFSL